MKKIVLNSISSDITMNIVTKGVTPTEVNTSIQTESNHLEHTYTQESQMVLPKLKDKVFST